MKHFTSLLIAISLFTIVQNATAETAEKPNVVIIFCDDLGYGDIGPFGSENHRTPNIDKLAEGGRRFTSFYVTSGVCSPSRSSLMTGCYPIRVGLHQNEKGAWVLFPGNSRGLNPSEITIAEVLKSQGYATAAVGKWHLGDQPCYLPTSQGFDRYFGIPFSNDMGYDNMKRGFPPLPMMEGEKVIEEEPDQHYLTPRYTDFALKFIREHKDEPFFLYMPHTFPHRPIFASPNFAGKSKNGDFGDAVEEIDWSVGQILDTLDELDLSKKTLVVFTSDNGARLSLGGSNGPLRGQKGTTWEGGQRVCCVMRWPGIIPAGTSCDEICSTIDMLPTIAKIAGTQAPTNRIIDGCDIRPLMTGEPSAVTPHDAFYFYFKGQLQAVRSGKWKLRLNSDPLLVDLEADIGETTDLSADNPEVVAKLMKLVELARADLGDNNIQGPGCRKPGHVDNPTPQTHRPTK